MATAFKCPRCKKICKLGRLRATYKCPFCGRDMVITHKEKLQGYKDYRKNFFFYN